MDGVLSDFDEAVRIHMGVYPHEIPDELMTKEILSIPDFWLDMPPMPDMKDIWDYAKQFNPYILTARASWDNDRCVRSKPLWLMKHIPDLDLSRVRIVRRSEKANYAKTGTENRAVLVDDHAKNILEWSHAGGHGILHQSAKDSIFHLSKKTVQKLISQP